MHELSPPPPHSRLTPHTHTHTHTWLTHLEVSLLCTALHLDCTFSLHYTSSCKQGNFWQCQAFVKLYCLMLHLHDIHSSGENPAYEDSNCREQYIPQGCHARIHCLPTGVNRSEMVLLITNRGRGEGGGDSDIKRTGAVLTPFRS